MKDIESKEDIKLLVDRFYGKVVDNELLAPVFKNFGTNWQSHLPRMYDFWITLLLHEKAYQGDRYVIHEKLPIHKPHYDEWVRLFEMTIDENFKGFRSERAKMFAKTNAQLYLFRMHKK